MKAAWLIPSLASAFLFASAAAGSTATNRYEYINGDSRSHASYDVVNGKNQFNYEASYYYALLKDRQTGKDILCSGFEIKTAPGTNADSHLPYTSSPTVSRLWQKVDENMENLAQYGSCMEVNASDLKEQTTQFIYHGRIDYSDIFVLKYDPAPADNSSVIYGAFFDDFSNGVVKAIEDREREKGSALDDTEIVQINRHFENEFIQKVETYLDQAAYSPNSNAYSCPNAGFYQKEIIEIESPKGFNGEIPLCPGPAP
ncbi:MAG: hypothetical protein GC204_09400 [Chloroflexi bacterium]|nr:hypothetical protein [Chloroflexota bacterium]